MAELQEIRVKLDDVLDRVVGEAKNNLQSKGHVLSGKLLASIEKRVLVEANTITGLIEFEDYGAPQDTGIAPQKIPFSLGSGAGKSKYIEGLIRFVKARGFGASTLAEQKSIAFAIARTHKKLGMHTKDGRIAPEKARWFSEVVDRLEPQIEAVLQEAIENNFENIVNQFVRDERFG